MYVVVGQAPSPKKRRETKKERLRRKKESQRDRRRERRPKKYDGKGVKEPNDGDGEETGIVGALAIAMVACLAYAIASVIIGGICMCMCMPSAIVVPIEVLDMPVAATVAAATAVPDMLVAATVAVAIDVIDLVSEDDEPHWTVDAFRDGQARFLMPAAAPGHTRPSEPPATKQPEPVARCQKCGARCQKCGGSYTVEGWGRDNFGPNIEAFDTYKKYMCAKGDHLSVDAHKHLVCDMDRDVEFWRNDKLGSKAIKWKKVRRHLRQARREADRQARPYSSESRTTKMPERFKSHWSYKAFRRGQAARLNAPAESSCSPSPPQPKRRRFYTGSIGARITVTNSGRTPTPCTAIEMAPWLNAPAEPSSPESSSSSGEYDCI